MSFDRSIQRYRRWYATLLRLYPQPYRGQFAEGMEQTFSDILRERVAEQQGVLAGALWMFADTFIGIIKENLTHMTERTRNIFIVLLVTALILMIPLVAMRFSDDVVWTLSDFVFAGTLLLFTGLAFEAVMRKAGSRAYRAGACMAVATTFLLIWINAAVGIIGSENNDVNLLYFGVVAVGVNGAFIVRLRARGMARVMFSTAVANAAVPMIALIIGDLHVNSQEELLYVARAVVLNGFFIAMWIGSGLLFWKAAR